MRKIGFLVLGLVVAGLSTARPIKNINGRSGKKIVNK